MKEFILLGVVVIILLFCSITFIIMWFSGTNDKYGDRLDGIKKVELNNGYLNDIVGFIKKDKTYVSKVSFDVEGKLLSLIVTVSDDTAVDEAKTIGNIVIENLTDKELKFYDIQLYIKDSSAKEESSYPIIGYKHKTSENFVWSNN